MTLRRCRHQPITIGVTEMITMAMISSVKFCLACGMLPKKYPTKTKPAIHAMPPTTLCIRNRRYVMLPMPATKGAQFLVNGMNRAMTIVIPP